MLEETAIPWVVPQDVNNNSCVFTMPEHISGHATNNLVEYEVVISLITNASALGIRSLVVRLDSKLIIS